MSTSDAAAAKKLAKASAKKEARFVESLRTLIGKKGFDVKSLAEALLLPPPAPKVKKESKETVATAWVRDVVVKHASEYDAYVAGLPEAEKTSANGKPKPVMVIRKNFAKKFQTDHATVYDTFKAVWESAHPITPVEEDSATESGSGSATDSAADSATESASPKKKKSSKASPAASTAPAPTPALTVETAAPPAAKKGTKKSPAAATAAAAATEEETPVPAIVKTTRKVNPKK